MAKIKRQRKASVGKAIGTRVENYHIVDLAFTAYMFVFTAAIIWLFQAYRAYSNTTPYTGAIRYFACPMPAARIKIE
jgi:hypothetical protein